MRRAVVLCFVLSCAPKPPPPPITWAPCALRDAEARHSVQGQCATFEVPENWEAPAGKKIALKLGRVVATRGRPAPDPVLLIPGGPGQGALSSFAPLLPALGELNRARDILLVDPRGTGESAPLTCPIDLPDESPDDRADVRAVLACKDKLSGDPKQYHTDNEVRDLEAVRKALGLQKWNLYGGSYGTRVALEYMRTAPEALRAVVLDGVVPHDLVLGSTHHLAGEAALERLAARTGKLPPLIPALLELRTALEKKPMFADVEDSRTGENKREKLDARRLTALVRFSLYAPEASALLPFAVDEAQRGRPQRLVRLGTLGDAQLAKVINPFVGFTVGCREDMPYMTEVPPPTAFFGFGVAKVMRDVCKDWPADKGPPRAAVASALPALLLSGELDPVTPPSYAERALKTLSNAKHLVAPGSGHITLARGCMPSLVAQFLDTANPAAIDGKCLEPLRPFPVFHTVNGP